MSEPYLSLPLKYRPMVFEDLVGQEVLAKYLATLSLRGQAKNIITYGAFGSGKTTSTRIYSRALNCTAVSASGSPCNECANCVAHIQQRFPDYMEVDGASQSSIADVLSLQDVAKTPPMLGRFRIIMIDEAQGLSKKAWDTLLKITEEPPPYLCFLFSTTEVDKIRPAIISRCQELEVKTLNHALSVTYLQSICEKEGIVSTPAALDLISFVSKGHPRSLLKNLEQCIIFDELTPSSVAKVLNLGYAAELLKFYKHWMRQDLAGMKKAIEDWGASPQVFVKTFQEFNLYLIYSTIRSTGITLNPVFDSIPKPELNAIYNWLMSTVSPTIDGGVPTAILALIQTLGQTPVENEISLDMLLYTLIQLAHEHKFIQANFGKVVIKAGEESITQKPLLSSGRGRQFTRYASEAAANLRKESSTLSPVPQGVPMAPPEAPSQELKTSPPEPPADKPVFAHALGDYGFGTPTSASSIISL